MTIKSAFDAIKRFFLHSQTFCLCLPVRIGVIVMSLLGVLLAGILSIILWYEVAIADVGTTMDSGEKGAIIAFAFVETLLFAASVLGFVGTVVRKQLFVLIYAYFIYVHFALNLGVAAYFLWMITHAKNNAVVKACQDTVKDAEAKQQCTSLLDIAQAVYFTVASLALLVELYGVLIVARYVHRLRHQKLSVRQSRLATRQSRINELAMRKQGSYKSMPDTPPEGLPTVTDVLFDPYRDYPASINHLPATSNTAFKDPYAVEAGYGGGTWTYDKIGAEESDRLKRQLSDDQREDPHTSRYKDDHPDSGLPVSRVVHDGRDAPPSYLP